MTEGAQDRKQPAVALAYINAIKSQTHEKVVDTSLVAPGTVDHRKQQLEFIGREQSRSSELSAVQSSPTNSRHSEICQNPLEIDHIETGVIGDGEKRPIEVYSHRLNVASNDDGSNTPQNSPTVSNPSRSDIQSLPELTERDEPQRKLTATSEKVQSQLEKLIRQLLLCRLTRLLLYILLYSQLCIFSFKIATNDKKNHPSFKSHNFCQGVIPSIAYTIEDEKVKVLANKLVIKLSVDQPIALRLALLQLTGDQTGKVQY